MREPERRRLMLARQPATKIRPDHLDRLAIIYVRQSTLFQVRENSGSTLRQYDLVKRAEDLGWTRAQIQVVDQDQGQSGASIIGRDGFQWLVAEVGLGHVGAVLSLEVSRLARSCSDWYRLLEICALTETLVIDEEGVYDPGSYNDRLLLGFKGTMSEAELHWLHQRLQGGKLTKAEQGQLRFRLPSGLVYDPVGRVVLDPDEAVQEAIRLVFTLFEQTNSALAVVSHFAKHQLRFPTRHWGGARAGEMEWVRLCHDRVLWLLRAPDDGTLSTRRLSLDLRVQPGSYPIGGENLSNHARGAHRSGSRRVFSGSHRACSVGNCALGPGPAGSARQTDRSAGAATDRAGSV